MKNITKNNSMLHRMIALVMAVVMTLTLVAIDSHFHLFADEAEVAANEVDTIDVTNVLKGYSDGHEATVKYASNKSNAKFSVNKADIADIKLTAKVGDEDITVEGKDIDVNDIKYLTYKENATDDKDKLNKNPATPTDADKTSALSENVALTTDDDKNTCVALYYAYKKDNAVVKYIYMGTAKVLYDDVAPEIDVVEVNCNGALNKKSYYLVDTDGSVSITFNTLDAGSGVDKIVSIKNGSTDEVELENDRFEFRNNDESAVYRFKVYDKAGNSKELGNQIVFKRVNTTPKSDAVNLTIEPLVNQKLYPGYYITNESMMKVTAVIKDEDVATAGNKYTGIDKMKYTLYYVLDTEDPGKNKILNTAEFTDDGEKLIATFVINSFGEDEKQIAKKLYVKVADELNNSTLWLNKYKQVVFIDSGKPSVGLSNINIIRDDGANSGKNKLEDYNGLLNKWAKSVSMDLAVSNNYSYIGKITYDVTGADKKNGTLNESEASGAFAFNKNVTVGTTNGSTIKLDKGGEYDVTFTAESYAGGKNSATVHVCIDDVKPELVVKSAAKNNAELGDESYTIETSETLKLDYSDATSGIASAKYKVTRNGVVIKNDGESEWKDVDSTKKISLADAGEYVVVIEVTDNAGNKTTKTINVKVDNVALQTSLVVTQVEPNVDSKSDVNVKYVNYLNWGDVYVLYTVTGYALNEDDIEDKSSCVPFGGKLTSVACDKTVKVEDLNDGIKRVEVLYHIAKDNAQGKYTFSINAKKHFYNFEDEDVVVKNDTTTLYYDVEAPQSVAVELPGGNKIGKTYYYGPKKNGSVIVNVTAIDDNATYAQEFKYKYEVGGTTIEGTVDAKNKSSIVIPYGSVDSNKNYKLKLSLTDKAHNTGVASVTDKDTEVNFYIDTKKPEFTRVTVNDKETDGKLEKEKDYYSGNSGNVKVTVRTKDNVKVSSIKVTGKRDNVSFEETVKDKNIFSKTYKESGKYELTFCITDEVGNTTEKTIRFVIDNKGPELTVDNSKTHRFKDDTTLKFTVTDDYAVDEEHDVVLTVKSRKYNEPSWSEEDVFFEKYNGSTKKLVANYKMTADNNSATVYSFSIRGCDYSGNELVIPEELANDLGEKYYIDKAKPVVNLDDDPAVRLDDNIYLKEAVSFKVIVKEQFKVLDNKLTIENRTKTKVIEPDSDVIKIDSDGGSGKSNKISCKEEGEYNILFTVKDECGNAGNCKTHFFIDKTKPEITIGNVNSINNSSVTLPITFTDNIKGSKYAVKVVRKDSAGNVAEEYTDSKAWSNNNRVDYTRTFDAEGDYTITVSAEDKAGNKADTKTTTFRIDKTAPVISISGMNDKQTTGVTATISVDEAFSFNYEDKALGSSDFNVTITKKTDGTAAANVATLGKDNFTDGNPHTATFNCSEDGEYTITANAKDLAGNVAESQTKIF